MRHCQPTGASQRKSDVIVRQTNICGVTKLTPVAVRVIRPKIEINTVPANTFGAEDNVKVKFPHGTRLEFIHNHHHGQYSAAVLSDSKQAIMTEKVSSAAATQVNHGHAVMAVYPDFQTGLMTYRYREG